MIQCPEISIIIPIYNAEEYLEECLKSVQNQNFEDYEVLMINDGSSDSSMSICQHFQQSDDRFILVNQENSGVCSARNHGLRISRGKYISFVDADDKIDCDFLSVLIEVLLKTDSDIVMCDFYNENGCECKKPTFQILEGSEIFEAFFRGNIYNRIMNKLYRKETIGAVYFPEDRVLLEDAFWTSNVLENAHRITIIPEAKYYYRVISGSLSHRKYNELEKAVMYRNEMERYIVLSRNLTNTLNKQSLIKAVKEYLDVVFVASNDLSLMGVHDCMQRLIDCLLFGSVNEEEFTFIRHIKDPGTLHHKYLMRMLFRVHTPIKLRMIAFYRLLSKGFRRNK